MSQTDWVLGAITRSALQIREVIASLTLLIVLGGVTISQVEDIPLSEAIYFAFIRGLSIGYGDISRSTSWGQLISVLIGLVGMIFVGITVAIATRALAAVVSQHSNKKP